MRNRHKKLRKNPAALISAFLVLISGFLFQLFHTSIMGESLPGKKLAMFDYILTFFKNSIDFTNQQVIFGMVLVILFTLIFLFYLLNGLGVIYNRYSRYASFLTFAYLIDGLIIYKILNQSSISWFGAELTGTNIGLGIYFISIIGILYLFLRRGINSLIRL